AERQGVLGEFHPPRFVRLLKGSVHERLGLAEGGVLVALAAQAGDVLPHGPFDRASVGEFGWLLRSALGLLSLGLSLLSGHRTLLHGRRGNASYSMRPAPVHRPPPR